ncbi:pentapeptide repeat-containing protein [Funiculus sociatus GB2-A5]|uniref:Pentapeptide repeat-containing protein n=2 Tax=Funiculus TaxID=2886342 RepID=A0ABV0JNV7_9CYAN|nr:MULTISPECIES: pentapeptide repeat-containing protein [unclassified Trichocoleus]MBD1907821.1 pentapeptide repeat-containing protein [Trichocoleus sp. FACHB-832]MBD2063999.1 pentapeptide repeat-containing protein [Trichocoleus sp. FACHB-6]
MGWNENKTGEQSNGLKIEVAIFILLIIGAIVISGFWLGVGWPDELPDNFSNLLTVEAVKEYLDYKERLRAARLQFLTTIAASLGAIGVVFNLYYTGKREEAFNKSAIAANKSAEAALENAKAANKSAEAALENAKAAQDKQITERFTKAVEQLASQEIAVRLGGIYALERIAKDSDKDHWTIMEVLTAFVREPPPLKVPLEEEKPLLELPPHIQKIKDDKPPKKLRIDIQAALTVIGRRNCKNEEENQRLDLHNTDIRGADLSGANLKKANLNAAILEGAILVKADLEEAYLMGANLKKADLNTAILDSAILTQANLEGAYLTGANLKKAWLEEAILKRTELSFADLKEAQLIKADLEGAILIEAKLEDAKLKDANLQGTDLSEANLQRANFIQANLQGANLSDTNLQGARLKRAINLESDQIERANGDNKTSLPDHLKAPEHWIESD